MKKRNKKILLLIVMLFVLMIMILIYFIIKDKNINLENLKKEQQLIEEITNHYNEYVITNKKTDIYNAKEEIIGKINSNIELSLVETEINKNTKYFSLKDFEDSYIKYQDVDKIDSLSEVDSRYKNYILFNENIITKNITAFYDDNNNLVYEFNISYDLPIIIKNIDRYGVEFNNKLLYVKKDDVSEIKDNHNTDLNNASDLAILNYHAFYDENNIDEVKGCPTIICHSKAQFKTHLDYIKENNIFTVTMEETENYIDGKIRLPKSVLITIDDGGRTKHGVDMLTEYKMNATIFLVTSWFNPDEFYKSDYIELHSHSHNLHNGGDCPGGQGGAIKCLDKETLLNDLKKSRELLNNTTAFCYPFYEFNNYSISVLKEAGFTMAFAGGIGNKMAQVGVDKFRIPRYAISKKTTIENIDNYFKQIKN